MVHAHEVPLLLAVESYLAVGVGLSAPRLTTVLGALDFHSAEQLHELVDLAIEQPLAVTRVLQQSVHVPSSQQVHARLPWDSIRFPHLVIQISPS